MLKLQCVAQNYDWGVKGAASTVGRLYALSSGAAAEAEKPYAEFWMGTHPSGPSHVLADDGAVLLKDYIASNPGVLGDKVNQIWPATLPFLFKVSRHSRSSTCVWNEKAELDESTHLTSNDVVGCHWHDLKLVPVAVAVNLLLNNSVVRKGHLLLRLLYKSLILPGQARSESQTAGSISS